MKISTKTTFPPLTKTIFQMIGPSVVFVALSLNGGEMLLWPDLVSRYGLQLLWIVPVILLLQYGVNIEIERYTLVTGQNTLSALYSKYPIFKPLVIFSIFISLLWPAWISIGGNILAYTLNISSYGPLVAFILMLIILFLWRSKSSYLFIEYITKVGLSILLVSVLYIFVTRFDSKIIVANINNNFTNILPQDKLLYLSALAFGGVTGVLNLAQSSWISNKKYGVSLLDNNLIVDYANPISIVNYKKWFKAIAIEHFVLFWVGNILGIFLISLIAVLTLPGQNISGFRILQFQVDYFKNINPILGYIWGMCIFILFFMAQITILDAGGHLLKSVLKKQASNDYSIVLGVLGLLILAVIVINHNFNQPSSLLQISAIISSFVMVLYPILVLKLNVQMMPEYAKPKFWNQALVYGCVLLYLYFTVRTVMI